MALTQQPFVGFENEMLGYELVLVQRSGPEWEFCPIGYGMTAASTAGTSRVGKIRYAELQVEGAASNPKKGMPEHVGGPTRVPSPTADAPANGRQRANSFSCGHEAFAILRRTLFDACSKPVTASTGFTSDPIGLSGQKYFFLKNILDAYNRELEQLAARSGADSGAAEIYRAFKMTANDRGSRRWAVSLKNTRQHSLGTQANVEIPFRSIGEIGGAQNLANQLEPRSKSALEAAQRYASGRVNSLRFSQPASTKGYLQETKKNRAFEKAINRRVGVRSGNLDAAVTAVNRYVDSPSRTACEHVRNAIVHWMKGDPKEWANRGEPLWREGLASELRAACRKWGAPFTLDEKIGEGENSRLNALFALYYFGVFVHNENQKSQQRIAKMQRRLGHTKGAVSEGRATADKDRWGFLPKVEWKDLIEHALGPADRTFLDGWTRDAGRWGTLKSAMNEDLDLVQKAGLADPTTASWVLDRNAFHEKVFKNGGAISSTGKPLPVSKRQASRGNVSYQEPMVVFEARANTDLAHHANQAARQQLNLTQLVDELQRVQRMV